MSDLWNEHIAGPTSGTKDITVTQPGEGLLRITGSTTGGLNAHNLKYTFTRFSAAVDSGVSLVFDDPHIIYADGLELAAALPALQEA